MCFVLIVLFFFCVFIRGSRVCLSVVVLISWVFLSREVNSFDVFVCVWKILSKLDIILCWL